jgi:hypothetical protein
MKRTITIEVSETVAQALDVLTDGGAAEAIERLASHAADGVVRPGAWERRWVCQVFGDDWAHGLEPEAEAPWRVRPIAEN